MLRKISFLAITISITTLTLAQDSSKTSALKLSGSADVYYRYNFQNPKASPYNSYTGFTHSQNSFELGMVSVKAEHSLGKASFVVDLGFGTRAEEFSYNDDNTRFAVKQAYVTYAPSSSIKFTFGSWATHIGYEVLDAYLNRNYSMSYMFSYGPFSHTGIKADIALNEKTGFMIGVANPSDFKSFSGAPKTILAQFSTSSSNDKLKLYLNFQGGKQNDFKKLVQGDVVLTYALSNKLSLGYNGTIQSVKSKPTDETLPKTWTSFNWWGSALYVNYDPVQWFGLTLRSEFVNDKDEYIGVKNVFAPTLSGNFRIDDLTIIPEFRLDKAKNAVFTKSNGDAIKSTGSFAVAAVYHF